MSAVTELRREVPHSRVRQKHPVWSVRWSCAPGDDIATFACIAGPRSPERAENPSVVVESVCRAFERSVAYGV